jgi:pyruvate dehydrogenase E2 component (dihydrolipoamide acetyltransferase)
MSQSWQIAPHVTINVSVDMTAAAALRKQLAQVAGGKVSYTEIITRCAARALTEFEYVNASLTDGRIVTHDRVNIGMAVALDDGLIVPVIRDADQKTVIRLGEEIRELSGKARAGRLGPDDVSGGTFTVTNLGMFGVDSFTPIINQPESAILGVGRIVDTPVVVGGEIVIRPLTTLCLSFDHRLIDGAVGAKFLARVVQLLEQPLLLV